MDKDFHYNPIEIFTSGNIPEKYKAGKKTDRLYHLNFKVRHCAL